MKKSFICILLILTAIGATPALSNTEMHLVPVLAQPLARGDIISGESVVMQEMKRSPAGIDYITDTDALVGLAAKRPLRAGVPLRSTDLTQPKIIAKGELITISFEAPGLSLSVRGKALQDGVLGQAVRVINTQTGRNFEAVALAPGHVSVSAAAAPAALPPTAQLNAQ